MRRRRIVLIGLLVLFVMVFGGGIHGYGETFLVTTVQDGGSGSLREALQEACADSEDDYIYLQAGTYVLEGAAGDDANISGDLDIDTTGSITIIGLSADEVIIDGGGRDRVFHIIRGHISIKGVTIQNGMLKCDNSSIPSNPLNEIVEDGGGIWNQGTLELKDCVVTNNKAKDGCCINQYNLAIDGGKGGGIYNSGTVEMVNCTISNNESGKAGTTTYSQEFSGNGGGVFNRGVLWAYDSTFSGNKAADGATSRPGGDGGLGGGICNSGTLNLHRCVLVDNSSGNGGMGIHSHGAGKGGDGGAVYNSTDAIISYCAIINNSTGDGSIDGEHSGNGGNGGGVYNNGVLVITYSEITGNTTGDNPGNIFAGNGGNGGGIYNEAGSLKMSTCTVGGNRTGRGGAATELPQGEGGYGGGVYNSAEAACEISSCTISNNSTGMGANVLYGGDGGGIFSSADGSLTLLNTILSGNSVAAGGQGADGYGTFQSKGYNLIKNTTGLTMTGDLATNQVGIDPCLDVLGNYGGLTRTYALKSNSPVIDAGMASVITDQRSYQRPYDITGVANVNDGADIGAYEYHSLPIPEISLSRTSLIFGAREATIPDRQSFIIMNSGSGELNWSVTPGAMWINCNPGNGTGMTEVEVSVNPAGLEPGTYMSQVMVESADVVNSPQYVTVTLTISSAGSSRPPFGEFETPLNNSTVQGSIPITGWALDDIGVERVEIYREEGNSLVFIDNAVFIEGARPDVERAYMQYPQNSRAGWGYMMLTYGLPNQGNGVFTIHALAIDKEGNATTLGKRTIMGDNIHAVKPFGAIDTPKQGNIVSGHNFVNFGWALTPMPNEIPQDGSTIHVYIDGVNVGKPFYNLHRTDVFSVFPGYANSHGAGGYFNLDTLNYKNGLHTISWSVTDNAGNTDGIGSRFFSIYNSASNRESVSVERGNPTNGAGLKPLLEKRQPHQGAIKVRKGFSDTTGSKTLEPDENGMVGLEIHELERVELVLSGLPVEGKVRGGYLSLGVERRPLPVGSTLDCEKGIFYWQPGPGFLGEYRLVFIMETGAGVSEKTITVKIVPGVK